MYICVLSAGTCGTHKSVLGPLELQTVVKPPSVGPGNLTWIFSKSVPRSFVCLFLSFENMVSRCCSPGCLGTLYVDETGPELTCLWLLHVGIKGVSSHDLQEQCSLPTQPIFPAPHGNLYIYTVKTSFLLVVVLCVA